MEVEYFEDNQTRTLEELPEKFRNIFSSYPHFNFVQSKVFDNIFKSNRSVVVAAPTGSGKTVILELAVVKLLMDLEECQLRNDFKIIYVSPVKALCRERFNDWNHRFSELGVSCIEVTGDGDDYFDLRGYNIIITTPEKWDSLTRKWRDNASLVQLVKLFMIDEVHLLNDNKRGPVLEAIVCRMKTVSKTLKLDCARFVAVSATIYNVEDLASWLGDRNGPAFYHKFGNEVRPVQLQKIVRGYNVAPSQSAFLFDLQLSYRLKALIFEYAKGKPTLVFCSTRKSVIQTTKILTEQITFHFSDAQREILYEGSSSIADSKLRDFVMCGVGFHHAGMSVGDRHAVQNLFVAGSLPILVATSTLAMGVNLPAHLVIIKSTQQYVAGHVEEYSSSAILQMIGRAGRPQFDTSATAIIMTKNDLVDKYEKLLDSKEVIESNLHHHLPEHLNSEIVLFTITDLGVAMEWIRCTFLYVRALKNPRYYGYRADVNRFRIEKFLENICLKEINGLQRAELITVNENGMDISPTPYGRLMSHYYLTFETFKILLSMRGLEKIPELLSALSEAQEFSEIQLRMNERKTLNDLNKNRNRETIRFPLQGRIKNRSMKVNCLIQACLGCLTIQDPALYGESMRIVKLAERLCKCLSDVLSKKEHHEGLLNAVLLAKCLHARLWENSPFVSRQLERIGPASGSLLAASGKTSFRAIEESNPRDLERIVNRAPPFGNILQEAVRHLPKYSLTVESERLNTLSYRTVVTASLLNADAILQRSTAGHRHWVTLVVGDSDNNLLNYTRVTDRALIHKDLQISITSKYPNLPHKIVANLISDHWVGIDVSAEVVVVAIAQSPACAAKTPVKRKKKCQAQGKGECDLIKKFLDEKVTVTKGPPQKFDEERQNDPFECCFDVDVVVEDLESSNAESCSLAALTKSHSPSLRTPSVSQTHFSTPPLVSVSDDSSDLTFGSAREIYDHIEMLTCPISLGEGSRSNDSGYLSGYGSGFQGDVFFNE